MSASKEFTNPHLVAIYDAVNPIDDKTDFFIELAKSLDARKIIDLGCGTGLLAHELVKSGHTLIGIEPASDMAGQAKRKYGDTAQWIIGGYEKLAADMQADMTIMTGHVAQFFLEDNEWKAALKAINTAIKPGGYLVFESRNPSITPFNNWPYSDNHELITDTPLGPIEWWCEKLTYADGYANYELHYLFRNTGEEIISANKLRFRTYEQLQTSLEEAGFMAEEAYGSWDKSPFEAQSPEMIFIAKKVT